MDIKKYANSALGKSWVLYAVREFMNKPIVRNSILRSRLSGKDLIFKNYQPTKYEPEKLQQFAESIIKSPKNKTVLFTATNFPDDKTGETHFQTFIVDKKNKIMYAMDPAKPEHGSGVYEPFVAKDLMKIFRERGYTAKWAPTSTAGECQKDDSDVFCQSWSLILQIHYARNHLNNVPMTKKHAIVLPTVEKERMGYLLEFLKEIIYNKCDAFEKEYQKVIEHVAKYDPDVTKKQLELATKIDPCQVFQSFTVDEFMTV